jgi:type I restriction enzyme S subunit
MLTTTGQDQLNEGAAGGAKMQLALDDIRGLRVPFVAIDEQRSIAASLDERTAKIDVLIAESERFIELAHERRSALITEAVTGQIDVREAA